MGKREWIPWVGGARPVPRGVLVDVQFRDACDGVDRGAAEEWSWWHDGEDDDIIAYREVAPRDLSDPEPEPTPTAGIPIWDLVIGDMRARDHAGRAKYRTPLQANNGRDALVDAYQEALDLVVYLRQAIEERGR